MNGRSDYWGVHTYGSTVECAVTANPGYEIVGYLLVSKEQPEKAVDLQQAVQNYTITTTLNDYYPSEDYTRTYAIRPIFRAVTTTSTTGTTADATTLLPSWDETSPVIVDMPTVDTAPEESTATKPEEPAAEGDAQTEEDAAAEPPEEASEPESTPLDAMIWDTGETAILPDDMQLEDADFNG